jgi:hypothetical protein
MARWTCRAACGRPMCKPSAVAGAGGGACIVCRAAEDTRSAWSRSPRTRPSCSRRRKREDILAGDRPLPAAARHRGRQRILRRAEDVLPDAEFDLRSSKPAAGGRNDARSIRRRPPIKRGTRPPPRPRRRARTPRPRSSSSPTARRRPVPIRSNRRGWPPTAAFGSTRSASAPRTERPSALRAGRCACGSMSSRSRRSPM